MRVTALLFCLLLCPCVMSAYCGSKMTCYEALEIKKGATAKEITAAFNDLSQKYKPHLGEDDFMPTGGDLEKYLLISKAHDVLSDVHKRKQYDAFLEQGGLDDDASPDEITPDTDEEWRRKYNEEASLGDEKDVEATPMAFFAIFLTLAITVGIPLYIQQTQGSRKKRGLRIREGRDLSFAG